MDRYVEVVGEGRYAERAVCFVAEVTVEVRASKRETALAECAALWEAATAALRLAGIADAEISEGGTSYHRPWYDRKKDVGQTATRKILLRVADFGRLSRALERLEPLQERDRKTVSVAMRQPEFEALPLEKLEALRAAFRDAREKARLVCAEAGGVVGALLRLEEGGPARRASGFAGDEDWGGDSGRFMYAASMDSGGGGGSAPAPDAEPPARTIFVRCRARFEILAGPQS